VDDDESSTSSDQGREEWTPNLDKLLFE
jgi:hypothetical protein